MGANLKFDVMWEDELVAKVETDFENIVKLERLSDDIFKVGMAPHYSSYKDLEVWLEDRCVPRTRGRAQLVRFLDSIGVSGYYPLEIVKVTHGVMAEDFNWIRFEGESLTWEEVVAQGFWRYPSVPKKGVS